MRRALGGLLMAALLLAGGGAMAAERPTGATTHEGVVVRPDVRLHYRVLGERGPVVVMLAGGPGGSVRMLEPLCEHLRARYRCVLLEQRGTDRSVLSEYSLKTANFDAYIADIEALRAHLGQERIAVVGNSWGMTLALAYAGAHPERVQAVATLGSGGLSAQHFRIFQSNRQARVSEAQQQRIAELHGRGLAIDDLVTQIARVLTPAYVFKPEAAARAAADLRVGDINYRLGELTEAILARSDELVLGRLHRITAPVLVVQGRQDLAPEEVAFTVADRAPNAEALMLDECGHMPWLDQPHATFAALDGFLGEHLA